MITRIDRDMIARAARAAGFELAWSSESGFSPRIVGEFAPFDPENDDGAAFRLMLACDMHFEPARMMIGEIDRVVVSVAGKGHISATAVYGKNKAAAARRAILECAVALDAERERDRAKLTPETLFDWARQREKAPKVREAAEHFGCTQAAILRACEDYQGSGYMRPATAIRSGSKVGAIKNKGDWLLEAYV